MRPAMLLLLCAPVWAGDRPPIDPPRDAFIELNAALAEAPGVFIGEAHEGDHPGYKFTLRRLGDFYVSGVRVLGLEMVNAVDQDKVDAYYADPHRNAGPLKEALIKRWGGSTPYRFELIEKARSLGIKTVAVDNRHDGGDWSHAVTNAFWAARVREALTKLPAGSKFVVYGGFYHGAAGPDRVPAIMGIPSLVPANLNKYPDFYFAEETGYGVVARDGRILEAVAVEGYGDVCREVSGRDPGVYGGLCAELAGGRGPRVAQRVADVRRAVEARGSSILEEQFFAALTRRLEGR